LVFDTSLLAAFDVPGVDPAAQQQAANLLSQQSYQPQSISPPSFSGGGGLAGSRPQTVTAGAPYYDPIAIYQGSAPVNYVPYSGPTVDMSNYLTNIFQPGQGTTNYAPAVGGSGWATSTSDPTSRYGGTNSTDWNVLAEQARPQPSPGPLGGMIANRVAGGVDTLRDIGGAIGDINIPTGWRGQTTIGEQLGNVVDTYNTDIPYYSDAMRNTIIPALESGVNAIAPYTPIAPYQWVANATGLPSAGEIAGYAAPVTAGDVALELIPGIGTVPDAWRAASRLSPDLADFSRVIREGGANLGNMVNRMGDGELGAFRIPGSNSPQAPTRLLADGTPIQPEALTVDPRFSKPSPRIDGMGNGWIAPNGQLYVFDNIHGHADMLMVNGQRVSAMESADVWKVAMENGWLRVKNYEGGGGLRKSVIVEADMAAASPQSVRRFVAEQAGRDPNTQVIIHNTASRVDDPAANFTGPVTEWRSRGMPIPGEGIVSNLSARLGPSELGAARVPKTPDAISAISRRLPGGDEKPIFEGIEQAAETPAPPKPLPGTEAYARGRGTTAPPPDYSQDPGYLESLARMADTGVSNPARTKTTAPARRTVTQGDGTVVEATPDAVQDATRRYLRRESTQRVIKVDPTRIAEDPEGFLEELTDAVLEAKAWIPNPRGGKRIPKPLVEGVSREEVKQALINNGAIKVTDEGTEVVAKADETLETAVAKEKAVNPNTKAYQAKMDAQDVAYERSQERIMRDLDRRDAALERAAKKDAAAQESAELASRGQRRASSRGGSGKGGPPKSPAGKAWDAFLNAWNLPRSMITSIDLSYPLRQGGMLIRHGQEFRLAMGGMLHAFFDDAYAKSVMDELTSTVRGGKTGKLHISDPSGALSGREEEFVSKWLDKIPGYRRFAQANTVFINKLRADVFDSVVAMWNRTSQNPTDADFSALANYINRATGRGNLGNNAASDTARLLSTALFSPSWMASRLQAPGYLFNSSRLVRNEAWKDISTWVGANLSLLAIGEQAGLFEVSLDPRAADFGKVKVGNTRVDLWGSYQQLARFAVMMKTGELASSSGAVYEADRWNTLVNFLRGKANPSLGGVIDFATGKNIIGEDVELGLGEGVNRLAPLAWQSFADAIEEGDPLQIALSGLGFIGAGTQTYSTTGEERNKLIADMGFTDATTGEALTEWHKLSNAQKAEAKQRNPELDKLSDPSPTTEARDAERAAAWEKLKTSGDFDAYFTQYSAITDKYAKEFAAQDYAELKNPGEWAKKLQDFYDKSADITDATEKQVFREQFEAGLNPEEQAAFKAGQQSSDPNYRKLQQAMDLLQPRYYDLREAAFDELKVKVDKLAGFENYADVWASGTQQDQQYVGSAMAGQLRQIRSADPQADAMLYILGRSDYVLTPQAKAIVDATLAKEGINKKSPNIGRP